jgi:hypothetical protein
VDGRAVGVANPTDLGVVALRAADQAVLCLHPWDVALRPILAWGEG